MKIHTNSAWSKEQIFNYLDTTITPMRISCVGSDGFPIICSLWFFHQEGTLWAASHEKSHLTKALKKNAKIGFEIATNDYPYHGVRGKANVTLIEDREVNILNKVIDKYLQGSNQKLANWLLSRQEDEYAIKINPISINSWDFSSRMEKN